MFRNLRRSRRAIFSLLFLVGASFYSSDAKAEFPADSVSNFIQSNGQFSFNTSGALIGPQALWTEMRGGQVSPINQYIFIQNAITQIIQNAMTQRPTVADSLTVAQAKFDSGTCQVVNGGRNIMVAMLLPEASKNTAAGAAADSSTQQAAAQQAQQMAQAFGQASACGASSAPNLDPNLLAAANR